jgi:ABC-type cobalamin/Fe3+-siderophores transport system ATPase subunit
MTLTRIKLDCFTAFGSLDVELSPGVNIFIGTNGTGKTHLLKVAYAACAVSKSRGNLAEKLVATFMPYEARLGRLAHRTATSTNASLEVHRRGAKLRLTFSSHSKGPETGKVTGLGKWGEQPVECAYIPVKEMLANAPGFRSLYAARQVHFEEIYADIVDRAYLPILRGPPDATRRRLLQSLQTVIDGKVEVTGETFFLRNRHGKLEFSLLAEGMRKLALLWLLIQNGTLQGGSVLLWDEPEANLNPTVMRALVEILLELQRLGVQIFIATHDYVLLKELDLQAKESDDLRFHALYRNADGAICHAAAKALHAVDHNAIADTFANLYDREVERSLGS